MANDTRVTGEYLLLERSDLRAWHYAHEDSVEPHQGFHDGAMAWTHCTCFGAAHRAVEPLLAEIERLRDGVNRALDMWDVDGSEHAESRLVDALDSLFNTDNAEGDGRR